MMLQVNSKSCHLTLCILTAGAADLISWYSMQYMYHVTCVFASVSFASIA